MQLPAPREQRQMCRSFVGPTHLPSERARGPVSFPVKRTVPKVNRTGLVGGLIQREDGAHGPTEQVSPRVA